MRAHNLPLLADVFRKAFLESGDLWFSMSVMLSVYDAELADVAARAEERLAPRSPQRPVPRRRYQIANKFRPEVEAVAARRGVSMDDLLGPKRLGPLVDARHEAMWRVRYARKVPVEWAVVAAAVNRSHHSTAIAGVRHFELRLANDPALRARVIGPHAERASA